MKLHYIEEVFEVTETCNNGNERRIKKSVFCEPFRAEGGSKIFRPTDERIAAAKAELKSQNYYNISHIKSKNAYITFA